MIIISTLGIGTIVYLHYFNNLFIKYNLSESVFLISLFSFIPLYLHIFIFQLIFLIYNQNYKYDKLEIKSLHLETKAKLENMENEDEDGVYNRIKDEKREIEDLLSYYDIAENRSWKFLMFFGSLIYLLVSSSIFIISLIIILALKNSFLIF